MAIDFTPFDEEFTDVDEIDFTPFSEMGEEEEEEQPIEQPESPRPEGSPVTRIAGQLGMRGVESILGLPRAVGEFAERIIPEKALIKGAETVGVGEGAQFLLDSFKKYAPYKLFPTEEQTRDFTKTLFGDLFEPKNRPEEVAGEAFGEFASLVFPFLGQVKPVRAALLTFAANAAQQTGEWFGLSDKDSNRLKFGTYVAGAFIQPGAAERYTRKAFAARDALLPQNAKVSSTPLTSTLDTLKKQFKKGGISSADAPALKQLENLEKEMQGALIPVDSLTEFKKKINIARGDIFKQLEGNKPGMKTAHRNMELVSKAADDAIELYAKQNPAWGKLHADANNAFAAVQNSKRASQFLKGKWPKLAIGHVGLSALLGHFAGAGVLAKGAAIGAAAVPTYHAAQTLNKIMRSPALRKEYFTLYQEAARGNLAAVEKSAKALDKGLQELEE